MNLIQILLADDDARIRSIVREYAQAEDWAFTEAGDGQEALRLFDDGFLRLFAQPSEQAFFLASRSWGLLVVVGTKHGDGYLKVATRQGALR